MNSVFPTMNSVFSSDHRIKLGIWGLGRGLNFVQSAAALNIDVVAGCDTNPHMCENFRKVLPAAFVTKDEDEFLAQDFDAVLIATYFRSHAAHTLKALASGKHVMCEVTSFFTPAEGVAVVEAVEKSGKVYHLLENYPFSRENMYLRKLWQEGFFGDFMYAEYDYVHECRTLSYAYNVDNGLPVEPGWTVHNWRSMLNSHYYNTHSLGPVMAITGLRPVMVSAMPDTVTLDGYLEGVMCATAAPSMVKMSNGGVMRNLMGLTTYDYHTSGRIWGTKAGANKMEGLWICVGGCGGGITLPIKAEWPELAELAESAGHGGGDFWELYYFAREILTGEPGPWNVYSAADVVLTGIMAARSCAQGGNVVEVPDFRKPEVREQFRHDEEYYWPKDFDAEHVFPEGHDRELTKNFTPTMTALFPMAQQSGGIHLYNMVMQGIRLYPQIADDAGRLRIIKATHRLLAELPSLAEHCRMARKIADAYPECPAGKTLARLFREEDFAGMEDTVGTSAKLRQWLDGVK